MDFPVGDSVQALRVKEVQNVRGTRITALPVLLPTFCSSLDLGWMLGWMLVSSQYSAHLLER